MIQKIKNYLVVLASIATLVAPVALAVPAYAECVAGTIAGSVSQGSNGATSPDGTATAGCDATGVDNNSITGLAHKVVNTISLVVGAISVIMIIIGGFRYITSGGDSTKVGGAKNTIIYAIIGLVIVALAQLIVHFVLNQATTAVQ